MNVFWRAADCRPYIVRAVQIPICLSAMGWEKRKKPKETKGNQKKPEKRYINVNTKVNTNVKVIIYIPGLLQMQQSLCVCIVKNFRF